MKKNLKQQQKNPVYLRGDKNALFSCLKEGKFGGLWGWGGYMQFLFEFSFFPLMSYPFVLAEKRMLLGFFWGVGGWVLNLGFCGTWTQPSLHVTQSAIRDCTCCHSPGSVSCSTKKGNNLEMYTGFMIHHQGECNVQLPLDSINPLLLRVSRKSKQLIYSNK